MKFNEMFIMLDKNTTKEIRIYRHSDRKFWMFNFKENGIHTENDILTEFGEDDVRFIVAKTEGIFQIDLE